MKTENTETTVEISGKSYKLDLEKAKKMGLIQEVRPKITSVKSGDVFVGKNNDKFIITEYSSRGYLIAGLCGEYSLYSDRARNVQQMINFINLCQWTFVKNINEDFKNLLKNI